MSVDIVRPRVGDLVFQLYGRPLHPELFDILAHRKVQREDYQLTLRITRTGHVITWENDDVLLTDDAPLAPLRRAITEPLPPEVPEPTACRWAPPGRMAQR